MNQYYQILIGYILYLFFTPVVAEDKPIIEEWLSFVGLQQNQWKVFARPLRGTEFQVLETIEEPRGIYFNAKQQQLIYIGASGNLRQVNTINHTDQVILQRKSKQGYAQPFMDSKSEKIYMMFMPEGKSSQSDIAVWNKGKITSVIKQLSSQFEPILSDTKWLYYGQLHCRVDCGHLVREVWRKNIISGESEQITMTGAITRQHIVDSEGKWLYFSSNKTGRYLLWRQLLGSHKIEQITKGKVHDSFPALDHTGIVYFIRRETNGEVHLLSRQQDGMEQILKLPKGVSDIRNLRINY